MCQPSVCGGETERLVHFGIDEDQCHLARGHFELVGQAQAELLHGLLSVRVHFIPLRLQPPPEKMVMGARGAKHLLGVWLEPYLMLLKRGGCPTSGGPASRPPSSEVLVRQLKLFPLGSAFLLTMPELAHGAYSIGNFMNYLCES